jgi:hypothetical protein
MMRAWKFLIFALYLILAPSVRAQALVSPKPASLSTNIFSFGQVFLGSSKDTIATFINETCDSMEVTNLETDLPFSIIGSKSISVIPGDTESVILRFQPTAVGSVSESLFFNLNLSGVLVQDTFVLNGIGIVVPANVSAISGESLNLITYPNPASSSLSISYNLVNPGRATLKLYDITGNEVATLNDDEESTGSHSVAFNASGYASGEYFCVLRITSADGIISSNYCKVVIDKP